MADVQPKLVDMAYTKAELKAMKREYATGPGGQPDPYPWGLSITLDAGALKKLGIDTLPKVGAEYHLLAVAKVTSVNSSARLGDEEDTRVGLQLVEMQIILKESAEEEKAEGADTPAVENRETKRVLSTLERG